MTAQTTVTEWPSCACGCGRPVLMAPKNDHTRGLVKGQPRKYASALCRRGPLVVVDITRTCKECGETKALHMFVVNKGCRSGYGGFCKSCDQVKRRARTARRADPYRELHRKLPPYKELKALYLGLGTKALTYGQIAKKFGCHTSTVRNTMKHRAERRGEWPLLARAENERRRLDRIQETKLSITPVGVAYVIEEFLEKTGMSRTQFAAKFGFDYRYITSVLSPSRRAPIAADYAVRLLRACEEPIPYALKVAANKYNR